jgi:anti-anti-sigma factor
MSFQAKLDIEDWVATVRLSGELDSRSAPQLNDLITDAVGKKVRRMVLLVEELTYLSSAGLRCLVFAHQKLGRTPTSSWLAPARRSRRPSGWLASTAPS